MEGNIEKKLFSIKEIILNLIKNNIRQYIMFLGLILIWILFEFLSGYVFLSTRNLSNLFLQSATITILAMGMVLVIVAGHIDLSVGSFAGFIGAVVAFLQVKMGFGTMQSVMIGLIFGVLIGCWQGYWIAYRKIPAFIVTLAGMLILRGGILYVTGGTTIAPLHRSFKAIGQNYLPHLFLKNAVYSDTSIILSIIVIIFYIIFELKQRKSRINYNFDILPIQLEISKIIGISLAIGGVFFIMISYRGIPFALVVVMFLALFLTFIANNTVFGRQIYAIGGNQDAAKLSGINIKKRIMLLFILMGALCAAAGIIFTSRLGAATAGAGNMFELDAIAGAVIGGTSFSGGKGTIFGAIIGALIMASIDNGMSLMNMDITYQYIVKGLILLLALWIDVATRQKNDI